MRSATCYKRTTRLIPIIETGGEGEEGGVVQAAMLMRHGNSQTDGLTKRSCDEKSWVFKGRLYLPITFSGVVRWNATACILKLGYVSTYASLMWFKNFLNQIFQRILLEIEEKNLELLGILSNSIRK